MAACYYMFVILNVTHHFSFTLLLEINIQFAYHKQIDDKPKRMYLFLCFIYFTISFFSFQIKFAAVYEYRHQTSQIDFCDENEIFDLILLECSCNGQINNSLGFFCLSH